MVQRIGSTLLMRKGSITVLAGIGAVLPTTSTPQVRTSVCDGDHGRELLWGGVPYSLTNVAILRRASALRRISRERPHFSVRALSPNHGSRLAGNGLAPFTTSWPKSSARLP